MIATSSTDRLTAPTKDKNFLLIDWIIGYCKGGVGNDTALFCACLGLPLIFAGLLFYGVPEADYLRLARAHNLGELCAVGLVDIFDF